MKTGGSNHWLNQYWYNDPLGKWVLIWIELFISLFIHQLYWWWRSVGTLALDRCTGINETECSFVGPTHWVQQTLGAERPLLLVAALLGVCLLMEGGQVLNAVSPVTLVPASKFGNNRTYLEISNCRKVIDVRSYQWSVLMSWS